jgi:Bacterial Ig-like domain (group 3)
VLALGASADPSRAAAASLPAVGVSVPAAKPVSRPKAGHRKSSSARRAECTAAARTERARKACAVKKAKARGIKPSASPKLAGTALSSPPAAAPSSAPVLAIAGPPPAEALAVPAPESTPPAESPGGSDKPPVEPPVEPKLPVEEPKPPVEAPPTEKASTTTMLASSTNPSTVGQAINYTAMISALAATGTVEFKDKNVAIPGCADQTVSFGSATCAVASYATAGEHAITATYSGDSNYIGSTSSPLNQVVNEASTSTTLTSSLNPSMVWQPVTYTAKVSPTAATGTVAFDEAGAPIAGCTAQTIRSGTAICTLSSYTVAGAHSITATYSGDGSHLASASSSLKQVGNKVGTTATTTTMSSSLNPSTVGEAVTYTVTLNTTGATGTVEFKQAGVAITGCTVRPVSSGSATCTVADPPSGWRSMTARYYGDSHYAASTAPVLTQMVNKKATTTTLSSSLNPSTVGEAVTYTVTLNTTAATGTVEFKQAGVTITGCTTQPISAGSAKCTVANPPSGWRTMTAIYSGDSDYAVSTSPGLRQTVNKKATTTALSSSPNPSLIGQAVTYTATVNSTAATGTVEFKQASVTINGCAAQPVNSGVATCTVTNLTSGWWTMTAIYSGDSNYAASTSPGYRQTTNKKATTTTLTSSLNPSTVGDAVTYTATLSSTAAAGTVGFQEEGVAINGCTAQPVNSGAATCTVPGYPSWSSYFITASYKGDSSYLASVSSTLTQTVDPPIEAAAPFRFFSPTSFWNEQLSANAPLDPSSIAVVNAFDEEIAAAESDGGGPTINATRWSVPIYTVPADQPTVKVTVMFENPWVAPALQAAFDAVPLPSDAQPAAGTDKHLVVWQPSTNRLWEFWRLENTSSGWQTEWGGAMQDVSSNPGVYGLEAWPGANSGWGGSASSLSLAGGLITLEDLERGVINHALNLTVPNVRAGVYSSPAQRDDGTSNSSVSLPEGARLRLDPHLDLAALHLPRLTLMIAEAAQRYGLFIRSRGVNVAFEGQDPIPTGTEPYGGPHGYYEGKTSAQLLASFPWEYLELLKMELHSSS